MATDIVIPQVGESITEGVIAAWLVGEGEFVDRDAPVLEIETDKITVEVPAPVAGIVSHSVSEGDTVEIGAKVGSIAEGEAPASSGSSAESAKSEGGSDGSSSAPAATSVAEQDVKTDSSAQKKTDVPAPGATASQKPNPVAPSNGSVNATPLAKKLADDHGIDITGVTPTGPAGRVREQDVLAYIQGGGSSSNGSAAGGGSNAGSRGSKVTKMSPLRQRIAQRLVEAQQTAAMLTTFNECDMTNVMALRSKHKEAFQKKHDIKLGFMSFFVKACVSALREFPAVNSYIVEENGSPAVEEHDYCDIAVAVGTKKGLVVPVLRSCETLDFAGIEGGLADLAARARDGKLGLDEMQGGTFTISNGGVYGSLMSTPILNPPQSGILGMHNIVKRPIEHPDKPGEIALRPMMYLALSYDHRIVDGAGAVGFLKHIKECIEDPERLLLDV